MHILPAESTGIAHPRVVHARVPSRLEPPHLTLVVVDADGTALRATGANAVRLLEEPDPLIHQEIFIQQRPHRTDIDHVALKCILQRHPGKDVDLRTAAAIHDAKLTRPRDLIAEANAPRAHHAAILIKQRLAADVLLRVLILRLDHPARRMTELLAVVLQVALARLIAHRAVQRMIQQEILHAVLLIAAHRLGVEPHFQSVLHRRLATREQLRGPAHLLRLGIGHLHFHQAKPARRHDAQPRVIAVMRNVPPSLKHSLENRDLVSALEGLSVDDDAGHAVSRTLALDIYRAVPPKCDPVPGDVKLITMSLSLPMSSPVRRRHSTLLHGSIPFARPSRRMGSPRAADSDVEPATFGHLPSGETGEISLTAHLGDNRPKQTHGVRP